MTRPQTQPNNAVIERSLQAQQTQAESLPLQILSLPQGQAAAYRELGQGTPLLMLHGFMATHTNWWQLMQALSPHFRCISLDLLGFGCSSKPPIQYDIAVEVEFVYQVAQALQLPPFVLIGHSFGGWVAAAYALAHPTTLKGLILAAPAGIRDDDFCGRYDHLRPLLAQTPWVDLALTLTRPVATLIGRSEQHQQIAWFRRSLLEQPVARQFLLQRIRPEDAVDTVEQELHRLQVPTLVIAAEQDDTIPLWHCQTYADRIPHAQLHILTGAIHQLPMQHWQALDPLIREFVDQLDP